MKIAVVGGGIAGLAAAFRLSAAHDVTLLERADTPGGRIRTQRIDGFTFEWGPNGFLSGAAELRELVREAGLDDALTEADPAAAKRSVYWNGRLHALPSKPPRALGMSLLSPLGKIRALGDLLTPPRPASADASAGADTSAGAEVAASEDESVYAFAERRFGREVAERIVAPALLGISGGDARWTSAAALFPRLVELERRHGSVIRGMMRARSAPGRLTTFGADGLQRLIDRLAERLGERLRTARAVERIEPLGSGWRIHHRATTDTHEDDAHSNDAHSNDAHGNDTHGNDAHGNDARGNDAHGNDAHGNDAHGNDARKNDVRKNDVRGNDARGNDAREGDARGDGGGADGAWDGEVLDVDAVIVATPAYDAARLVDGFDERLGAELRAIPYAPMRVAAIAFRARDVPVPLDGFGFLAARRQGVRSLGVLYTSTIFPDQAPDGVAYLRVFLGGAADPDAVALDPEAAQAVVRADLAKTLGITAEPIAYHEALWPRAIPQYGLGHRALLARIDALAGAHPRFALAGNAYRGLGLGDVVRDALAVATRFG